MRILTVMFLSFLVCLKNEDKTLCEEESTSKYSSVKIPNRNLAGSGEFLLTVYNPASSHGKELAGIN